MAGGYDFKVTDIVDPKAAEELKKLGAEFDNVGRSYSNFAKALAGGIKIDVKSLDEFKNKQGSVNAMLKQLMDSQNKLASIQEKQLSILDQVNKKMADIGSLNKLIQSMTALTANVNKASESLERIAESTKKVEGSQQSGASSASNYAESMKRASDSVRLASGEYSTIIQSVTAFDDKARSLSVSLVDQKTYLEATKNEIKAAKAEFDAGKLSYDDYMEKVGALTMRERELKASIQQTENILKSHSTVVVSTSGSYNEMNAAILQLEKRYKDLGKAQREGAAGNELLSQIEKLKNELKSIDSTMGNYQRNVGNYEKGALSLRTELRTLTEQMARLKMEGKDSGAEFERLSARAAQLKSAMTNANLETKRLASTTKNLDSVVSGVSLAGGGFAAATGAMQLYGDQSESVQESQRKLQATIAITSGLQAVQNNLQKHSAVMLGINKIQTYALAKAEAYRRLIQIQGTNATVGATAAQKAFNLVAKQNPYVLLAVALISVIGALALFANSSEKAYKAQKKQIEQEAAYVSSLEKKNARIKESSELVIKSLETQRSVLIAQGKGLNEIRKIEDKIMVERIKAHNKLKDQNKLVLDNLDEEAKKTEYLKDQLEGVLLAKSQGKKKVSIAFEIGGKVEDFKTDKAIELLQKAADESDKKVQFGIELKTEEEDIAKTMAEIAKKRRDESLAIHKEEKSLIRKAEEENTKLIANEFQKRQKEINSGYDNVIDDLKLSLKTEENLTRKGRQAINDTIISYEKQRIKELDKLRKEEAANKERDTLQTAVDISTRGTEGEMNARLALLKFENEQEIDLAIEKGEEINNIILRYERQKLDILGEYASEQNQKLENQYAMQAILATSMYQEELGELELLYKKGNIKKEEYEKRKLDITSKYANDTIQESVNMLEEQLKTENLSVHEREDLEIQLYSAKMALYDAEVKARQDADAQIVESEKQKINAIADGISKAGELLDAFNELNSALFDRKIQKIEEEQEANEAAYDADIKRIERLAEIGTISAEEAEARKRAAEDKTAAKEAELAKKKAELQTRQAKFEKANSLIQSVINTATSIIKTGAQLGFPAAIPFIAIAAALGAIQQATIIAQPIPKYAKGTDNHPGGLAVVGDAGKKETALLPSGQMWITPAVPTLVDLPKGTTVLPDAMGIDELKKYAKSDAMIMMEYAEKHHDAPVVNVSLDSAALQNEIRKGFSDNNELLKRQIKQQRNGIEYSAFRNRTNDIRKI